MLKKSIGLTAAALALGVVGLMANGCSSTSTSPAGGSDASTGSDARKDTGTNPGGDSGPAAPACYSDVGVSIPWGPATLHQNVCSDADIQSYFDLCLTAPEAGVDGGGLCDDFILSHVGCASCIIGPLKVPDAGTASGTTPAPVTYDGSSYTFLNIAACLGAISGADATCQSSFANAQDCAELDCEGCVAGDDANGTQTTACINYDLNSGACATSYPVDSTCATTVNGVADADAQSKCGISSSGTFEDGFKGIAHAFCGAP